MALDLGSVNAKIARAEEHIGVLENEIDAWLKGDPYKVEVKADVDRTLRFVANEVHHPNATRWSLLIGDSIHCLRGALDHLVYAIALKQRQGPITESESTRLAFHIIDDIATKNAKAKLADLAAFLGPSVMTAFERV